MTYVGGLSCVAPTGVQGAGAHVARKACMVRGAHVAQKNVHDARHSRVFTMHAFRA